MEKRKVDFDSPEWQEYFKGKSPEEIEEIKKLFEEKKFGERINNNLVPYLCHFKTANEQKRAKTSEKQRKEKSVKMPTARGYRLENCL